MCSLDDDPLGGQARERPNGDLLHDVDLDTALSRRPRNAMRTALLAATVVALTAALVFSLRMVSPMGVTTAAGSREATITSNVSSGTVYVNGRRAGQGFPATLRLSPGINRIAVEVPRFRRRECLITLPIPSSKDTCRTRTSGAGNAATAGHGIALSLDFTAADLLPGEWDQIRSAAEVGLALRLEQFQLVVGRGDHYAAGLAADGAPIVRAATATLLAIPSAVLSALQGNVACGAPLCPPAEDEITQHPPSAELVWTVRAGVTLGWNVRLPGGADVARVATRGGITGPSVTLSLAYAGGDGWRMVDSSYDAGARATDSLARQVAVGLCQDGAATLLAQQSDVVLLGATERAYLDGCVLNVRRLSPAAAATTTVAVVCRFGALLADDAASRDLFPTLPLASVGERNAAGR